MISRAKLCSSACLLLALGYLNYRSHGYMRTIGMQAGCGLSLQAGLQEAIPVIRLDRQETPCHSSKQAVTASRFSVLSFRVIF